MSEEKVDCAHFWVGIEVDAISIKEGYTGFNFHLKCIHCNEKKEESITFNGAL